jgi:hypothetical protein
MKTWFRFGFLLFFAFILAACGTSAGPDSSPAVATENVLGNADQVQPGEVIRVSTPSVIGAQQAVAVLAEIYGIDPSQIVVVNVEQATFSDSCLDLKIEGENCVQEAVPGYKVILQANGSNHTLHTTQNGNLVRIASVEAAP